MYGKLASVRENELAPGAHIRLKDSGEHLKSPPLHWPAPHRNSHSLFCPLAGTQHARPARRNVDGRVTQSR